MTTKINISRCRRNTHSNCRCRTASIKVKTCAENRRQTRFVAGRMTVWSSGCMNQHVKLRRDASFSHWFWHARNQHRQRIDVANYPFASSFNEKPAAQSSNRHQSVLPINILPTTGSLHVVVILIAVNTTIMFLQSMTSDQPSPSAVRYRCKSKWKNGTTIVMHDDRKWIDLFFVSIYKWCMYFSSREQMNAFHKMTEVCGSQS